MRRPNPSVFVKYRRAFVVSFLTIVTILVTFALRHLDERPDTISKDLSYYFDFDIPSNLLEPESDHSLRVNPPDECLCRRETADYIRLDRQPNNVNIYQVFLVNQNRSSFLYNLTADEFDHASSIPCNLYSMLLRGKGQLVLSYSLFGSQNFYYDKLANISRQIAQFYPGWFMRVYHDGSINQSAICDLECGEARNVDFCNIDKLPVNLVETKAFFNASHVHPTIWRYLALADAFVDVVAFRDSDSFILQREVDSVQVWLGSDKIGHIMRDHPRHRDPIMGGMWGFKPRDDRNLAKKIVLLAVDPYIAKLYNPKRPSIAYKTADQDFLSDFVFGLIDRRSIIHDSYRCMFNRYSTAWPTRRQGNCFVGSSWFCNTSASDFYPCPAECRPKEHLDWVFC